MGWYEVGGSLISQSKSYTFAPDKNYNLIAQSIDVSAVAKLYVGDKLVKYTARRGE
jgi:hypothetical protein